MAHHSQRRQQVKSERCPSKSPNLDTMSSSISTAPLFTQAVSYVSCGGPSIGDLNSLALRHDVQLPSVLVFLWFLLSLRVVPFLFFLDCIRWNYKLSFPSLSNLVSNIFVFFVGSRNLQLQDSSCSMFSVPYNRTKQRKKYNPSDGSK